MLIAFAVLMQPVTTYGQVIVADPFNESAESGPEETPETDSSTDLHSLYYSAHLPIDRRLSQDLFQAEGLLSENRYSEALALIDRVLATEEDSFSLVDSRRSTQNATSLKLQAKKVLAELPAVGRQALELELGVTARRHLNTAIRANDLGAIYNVAARYPLTEAAVDALLIAAQSKLERADYASAARIYDELLSWPGVNEQHGLALAAKVAQCWAAEGSAAAVDEVLGRVESISAKSTPEQKKRAFAGQTFDEWQTDLRIASRKMNTTVERSWLMEGGTRERNPVADCSLPHVWPVWQARTVKQADVAAQLQSRTDWQQANRTTWLMVASPLAVGDLVIARTPSNLIALDWKSGKRIWETRPDRPTGVENTLAVADNVGTQTIAIHLDGVEQRTWLDAVYGAISSDGKRVFAIRDLSSVNSIRNTRWGIQGFGGSMYSGETPSNALAAYDLYSEGKLLWEINAATFGNQDDGTFFLGPPIAVDETLYGLAEVLNSVHLIAIAADTGTVLWKQPLVNLERSVHFDIGRRLAGATPTYGNGLLLCPTGAGSMVAVDPMSRSLEWAYRFEVDESLASRPVGNRRHTVAAYQATLTDGWSRNRCIVSGTRAIVTAPETDELHAVDLKTGKKLWTTPRKNAQFVAGVTGGNNVVLLSARGARALDLETGRSLWDKRESSFNKLSIAGMSVLAGNQLIVPLSGGQIGVLDTTNGELIEMVAMRDGGPVGNLACHRGTMLAQSSTGLARYNQLAVLRDFAEQGLAESPPNLAAQRVAAEIAWNDGNLSSAIELLLAAYDAQPDDSLVRQRLSEALLAGLETDYSRYREQATMLDKLIEDNLRRLSLLRLHIDGSLSAGNLQDAFDYALQLYELDRGELIEIDANHTVLSERWFASRLARISRQADHDLQNLIANTVEKLRARASADSNSTAMWRLVRYFGGTPASRRARIELTKQMIQAKRFAEAELLLLHGKSGTNLDGTVAADRKLFAQLCGVQTELTNHDHSHDGFLCHYTDDYRDWPDGKVEVTRQRVANAQPARRSMRGHQVGMQLLSPRSVGVVIAGPINLALADGGTELVAWNQRGEVSHRLALEIQALQNNTTRADTKCLRFGHFVILGAGREVAVFDLRQTPGNQTEPQLWASQPDESSGMQQSIRSMQRQQRVYLQAQTSTDARQSQRYGELCNAAPTGIVVRNEKVIRCFHPLDGELLWERRNLATDGLSFGDSQRVFFVKPGVREGIVLSMVDGSTTGSWQRPAGKKIIATAGRHLAIEEYNKQRHFQVLDPLTGDERVLRNYSKAAQRTQVSPTQVAWLEPDGQFELIDLVSGEVQFTQQLEVESRLLNIQTLVSADTLIVATNSRTQAQHNTLGNETIANAPVVSGHVYALDLQTGKQLWDQPATVKGQGLVLLQPPASPVLVFASQFRDSKNNGAQSARVLCLDKRTGRSLAREDRLARLDNASLAIRVDQGARPAVTIDMRHSLLALHFSDKPRPPEPVAVASVEGVKSSISGGLFRIMQNVLGGSSNLDAPELDDDD